MSNQLRQAIEKARQYYITKLVEAGVFNYSEQQLYKLTLTELEDIYKNYKASK